MSVADKIRESLSRSSWIRKMFEQGDRLRRIHGPGHVHDFTLGNPDLEPPDCVTKRLQALTQERVPGMHKYMSNAGYPETRSAIVAHVGRKAGLSLTENHVVMTVGAGGSGRLGRGRTASLLEGIEEGEQPHHPLHAIADEGRE